MSWQPPQPLLELLTTSQVCSRYRLRPKAARRVMHAAGAFRVAGRLVVRAGDLAAYERRLADEQARPEPVDAPPRRRAARHDALPPGFWRES